MLPIPRGRARGLGRLPETARRKRLFRFSLIGLAKWEFGFIMEDDSR
jgi:hypothetical protein